MTKPPIAEPESLVYELPSFAVAGPIGKYYVVTPPKWIARHVETVEIETERAGRRRLTIDIELPRDPEAVVDVDDDRALFIVPLTMLSKTRLTSQIDVRDETGKALPLLTMEENAELTWDALAHAFQEHAGGIYPDYPDHAEWVIYGTGLDAEFDAALMIAELDPGKAEQAERIAQHIADLSSNSWLWVPIWGQPGERRILKFSYAITVRSAPVLSRRTENDEIALRNEAGQIVTLPIAVEAGIDWRATLARAISNIATSLGWLPYEISVDFPQLRGSHSYHLQLIAPDGLDVDQIQCVGPAAEFVRNNACDARRAHLYLSGMPLGTTGWITSSYRAHRPGFLNWSLSAVVITAMGLWFVQAHPPSTTDATGRQVAAAVLLILPALLVVFAVRQAEHPLLTRVLSGVRLLVMVAALASVAAAAALAGLTLGTWESYSEAWIWSASLATIASVGVLAAWLASFGVFDQVGRQTTNCGRAQFLARVVLAALLVLGLAEATRSDTLGLGEAEPLAALLLLLAGLLSWLNALALTSVRLRRLRWCGVLVGVVGVVLSMTAAVTRSPARETVFAAAEKLTIVVIIAACVLVAVRR